MCNLPLRLRYAKSHLKSDFKNIKLESMKSQEPTAVYRDFVEISQNS